MKVKISMGNTKMGKIPSVSLPPIKSCGNCGECAKKCYAMKAYRMYPFTKKAYDNNYEFATTNLHQYFCDIEKYIAYENPKYFRWHVSGDILNYEYLNNMVKIAKKHPKTRFLCFTKMYDVINLYLNLNKKFPRNLNMVFSIWIDEKIKNPHKLSIARTINKGEFDKYHGFKCQGNCSECGFCFEALPGSSVIFEMH